MGAPWERYQSQPSGPWEKYTPRPVTPTEGPGGYNVDLLPGRNDTDPALAQKGTIEALKMGGAIAGGMLAPQIGLAEGAPVLARVLAAVPNLLSRMVGAGAGSAAGGATGELVQGRQNTGEDLLSDFEQGATAEVVGTGVKTVAKPLVWLAGKALTKAPFGLGVAVTNKAGDFSIGMGKKSFDALGKAVGGNDAPVPAPNTLQVIRDELTDPKTGGWNPLAYKLFGKESDAPLGSRPAAEKALSGATPRIGQTTAWELTPKEAPAEYATAKPPGAQWEPWYVVHADGGAELFWRDPKMGLFRAAGASTKAKELLTEKQMVNWLATQRAGTPVIGVTEGFPASNGNYVARGNLFDVARRDDAIPWRELNDLGAKFRNRDFTGLGKDEIDSFMRLRDAIEQDVRGHSSEAAKAWDNAWGWYRFGRDPVGVTSKAVTKYAIKPAGMVGSMGIQELFQPSHEVRR